MGLAHSVAQTLASGTRTADRQALIVGIGHTGLSCARHLSAFDMQITMVDTRDNPPMIEQTRAELPQVRIVTGGFDPALFSAADLLVVSPGVALNNSLIEQARSRGAEVVGDIDLFVRKVQAPIIAITGSNGKSTVASLVGDMCKCDGLQTQVAGNIGTPVLDVLTSRGETDCYVLELSSFQLENTANLNAVASTILNISEDHMDRYSDIESYAVAKARVFAGDGKVVANRDDPLVMQMTPPDRPTITFGLGIPKRDSDYGVKQIDGSNWLLHGSAPLLKSSQVPLIGTHNTCNVLAAMALADCIGVSEGAMIDAIVDFRGLPHRMEVVALSDGVRWINDSKATNVGATVAALTGLEEPVVLIAGGDGKGADFSILGDVVAQRCRALILIGRDAPKIEAVVAQRVHTVYAENMHDAIVIGKDLAQPGDNVMLAPACASFDMYPNFERRGGDFKSTVLELI